MQLLVFAVSRTQVEANIAFFIALLAPIGLIL